MWTFKYADLTRTNFNFFRNGVGVAYRTGYTPAAAKEFCDYLNERQGWK